MFGRAKLRGQIEELEKLLEGKIVMEQLYKKFWLDCAVELDQVREVEQGKAQHPAFSHPTLFDQDADIVNFPG